MQTNGQVPTQTSTPVTPPKSQLDIAIETYENAIYALEEALPEATFEQKVAVLVARDAVEKKRQMDQNPQGGSYAQLLSLDARLKLQAKVLSEDDQLAQWKDSLSAAPNLWWWHLKYPLILSPNQAAKRYESAISTLESLLPHPDIDKVLEVLLARDAVEESRDNKPLPESVAKNVIRLDEKLKALSEVISTDGRLEDWKKSLGKTNHCAFAYFKKAKRN